MTTDDILIVCPQAVAPAWQKQIYEAPRKQPWRHQLEAAAWAAARRFSMLALDMGTGKSLIALLVIGLARLRAVSIAAGTAASRLRIFTQYKATRPKGERLAVIVNYDSVWRGELGKAIGSHKWGAIILDESHRIKSPGGRASRWLAMLARANPDAMLLCLTGTPMPHSPLDLYGQFRFLEPSVFGTSFARMRARYAACDPRFPSKVRRWLRQDELASILDANAYRVKADEVLDLPEAIHAAINVPLPSAARKFYDAMEGEMVAKLDAGTVTTQNALTKLLALQRATSGFATLPDGELVAIDGTPAKRLALEDWFEDLPAAEPCVIFCRFRVDIEEVRAACAKIGRASSELSGERNTLEQWQAGETSVLVVQIQSGGVGIDLTRAAYAVYYSLGFSLGDYEQSLARLRRPGQTRCVRYYHLVAENTVDNDVYSALQERREVVGAVLSRLSPRVEKEGLANA